MKNLYPKPKGRIHPSPSSPAAPRAESTAVLRLLPAAILALTAVLCNDDREVLAYLIMRSIGTPDEASDQRRFSKPGELHTSLFGCGCFDCYTTFWSRWDCSPDRELIHQAIEAFEDHLASSERAGTPTAKPRRRDRRLEEKGKKKGKECKEKPVVDEILAVEHQLVVETIEEVRVDPMAVEKGEEVVDITGSEGSPEMVIGERRKGWADVTAMFNSRLWSLWSPGD